VPNIGVGSEKCQVFYNGAWISYGENPLCLFQKYRLMAKEELFSDLKN